MFRCKMKVRAADLQVSPKGPALLIVSKAAIDRESGWAKLCLSPHIHICNLGGRPKEGRCSPVENVLEVMQTETIRAPREWSLKKARSMGQWIDKFMNAKIKQRRTLVNMLATPCIYIRDILKEHLQNYIHPNHTKLCVVVLGTAYRALRILGNNLTYGWPIYPGHKAFVSNSFI